MDYDEILASMIAWNMQFQPFRMAEVSKLFRGSAPKPLQSGLQHPQTPQLYGAFSTVM